MKQKLLAVAEFTRFEHTLFALPFAFMGAVLAAGGLPSLPLLGWIFLGLIGGRSASLMINDYVDEPIDARNPRTEDRPLPSDRLSHREALVMIAAASAVLFYSAYRINSTALVLSPLILVHAYVYPYTKRYTSLSHFVLGLNGSYAPIGGWIAVRGVDPSLPGGLPEVVGYVAGFEYYPSVVLGLALVFWYAGFDVIYALKDVDFDRREGLHSLPAVHGVETARRVSAVCHAVMLVSLAGLVYWTHQAGFTAVYFAVGVAVSGVLLAYEHVLADVDVDTAFFTVNAVVSFTLFLSLLAAVWL
ncbi:MAG: UbiA-like polyprenyltransferase [Halobacteriales archaeon]